MTTEQGEGRDHDDGAERRKQRRRSRKEGGGNDNDITSRLRNYKPRKRTDRELETQEPNGTTKTSLPKKCSSYHLCRGKTCICIAFAEILRAAQWSCLLIWHLFLISKNKNLPDEFFI